VKITPAMLQRAGACDEGLRRFRRKFPRGAKITWETLSHFDAHHLDWLAAELRVEVGLWYLGTPRRLVKELSNSDSLKESPLTQALTRAEQLLIIDSILRALPTKRVQRRLRRLQKGAPA
jgi:hypothetical protein